MKLLTFLIAFLFFPVAALAINYTTTPPACTVAQLSAGTCVPSRTGTRVMIKNADDEDDTNCASGEGAFSIVCVFDGSSWVAAASLARRITIGAIPDGDCQEGSIHIDTDETVDTNCATETDNNLCLCITDDNWIPLQMGLNEFYAGESGGNASETILSLNNYDVMNFSLSEIHDTNDCFSTTDNEICYTCGDAVDVEVIFTSTLDRTSGSATDIVTIALGKDTTGNIDDGDEFNEEYDLAFTSSNNPQSLALIAVTELTTDDCISLMAKTNNLAGGSGFTLQAGSLHIVEP